MFKRFFRPLSLYIWLPAGLWLMVLSQAPVKGADTPISAHMSASPTAKPVSPVSQPDVKQVYTAKCSFCHEPKPANALPDLKAWVTLLYTSGCPDVTIKLEESQRRAIKAFLEAEFKAPVKAAQPGSA